MEKDNFDHIQVLPHYLSDDTQRCHCGPRLMETLEAGLGDYALIAGSASDTQILCSLWPRPDKYDRYIQCSPLVSLGSPILPGERSSFKPSYIAKTDIQMVTSCKKVKELEVRVVLKGDSALGHSPDSGAGSSLCSEVTNLLRGAVVMDGAFINSHGCELGKLFGIFSVVVEKMTPSRESGRITHATVIKINKILSQERFEQKHKRLKDRTTDAIGGLDMEQRLLSDLIQLPTKLAHLRANTGLIEIPKALLLYGPPGTGKTTLVKKVAADCDAYLLAVNAAEVFAALPGETEENLRNLVARALRLSQEGPCVLFLDDVDALCPRKGAGGVGEAVETRAVSQLASLLDQLPQRCLLTVVGATSNIGALDPALRRPGRFEKEVSLGVPRLDQRMAILQTLIDRIPLPTAVDVPSLAESTPGFVGADLVSLVNHAHYLAVQEQVGTQPAELSMKHMQTALHSIVPSTQRGSDITVDYKPVGWEEIGGLEEAKTQLQQAIEWPLRHPDAFLRLGLPCPKGVLLHGPPGCAKTTLVRAAATSCHVTFLAISGGQLYSPYVGDSEKKLAEAFSQARAGAPCILFIDELDSVVGNRAMSGGSRGVQERVLSTLLNEMDGIGIRMDESAYRTSDKVKVEEGQASSQPSGPARGGVSVSNTQVLVVAATNRPDMLDDALLRPGRLDRIIYVPPPDQTARRAILHVHTRKMPLEAVDLDSIAAQAEGYTGADLENLCREAALHALSIDGIDTDHVTGRHFAEVMRSLTPSLSPDQLERYEKQRHTMK